MLKYLVYHLQVADFDFNNSEDDELQYKTFWERLRESFGIDFLYLFFRLLILFSP